MMWKQSARAVRALLQRQYLQRPERERAREQQADPQYRSRSHCRCHCLGCYRYSSSAPAASNSQAAISAVHPPLVHWTVPQPHLQLGPQQTPFRLHWQKHQAQQGSKPYALVQQAGPVARESTLSDASRQPLPMRLPGIQRPFHRYLESARSFAPSLDQAAIRLHSVPAPAPALALGLCPATSHLLVNQASTRPCPIPHFAPFQTPPRISPLFQSHPPPRPPPPPHSQSRSTYPLKTLYSSPPPWAPSQTTTSWPCLQRRRTPRGPPGRPHRLRLWRGFGGCFGSN